VCEWWGATVFFALPPHLRGTMGGRVRGGGAPRQLWQERQKWPGPLSGPLLPTCCTKASVYLTRYLLVTKRGAGDHPGATRCPAPHRSLDLLPATRPVVETPASSIAAGALR